MARSLSPWDAGTGYLNFTDAPDHARRFFDGGTLAQLRAIKASVDPDGVILANHPIQLAADDDVGGRAGGQRAREVLVRDAP